MSVRAVADKKFLLKYASDSACMYRIRALEPVRRIHCLSEQTSPGKGLRRIGRPWFNGTIQTLAGDCKGKGLVTRAAGGARNS